MMNVIKLDALTWLTEQGAHYALPFGRSKNKFETDWPNKPHTYDEAIEHANSGGNVGILTGKHSANIIALDRDIHFPETCEVLGAFAHTAKIIRTNAPERGKFLFRIKGKIPPTTSWKPEGATHPEAEFLGDSGQRHALCPPSQIDGGEYVLLDQECGIKEITPAQLDFIWRLITGGSIYKDTRAKEEAQAAQVNKDDYVRQVKDAWTTSEIFTHFGLITNGTERSGHDTRLLGHGGLLIAPDDNQWYAHADGIGGDKIDAWSYGENRRRAPRDDGRAFIKIIDAMAQAKGIQKPAYVNGSSKKSATVQVDPTTGEIKSKADTWLDALRALGHTFKLSTLEDMVEIDGKRLDDITRSRLYLDMVSRGVSKNYVDDCINVLAAENAYHPIKDYLNSLQWDGRNHLGIMLGHITGDGKNITYSNGDQPLHAALIPRWLIGCAARALDGDKEHAFKHQTPMLVFVGSQGIGKSSWVRWLVSGIGYEFHRESALDPHHPDHVRSAVTKWIWEVSELGASLRKGDRDALKGFITQEWHTYRKPWGRANITKPTLANFVGTVNPEIGFLDDPTGHRRFLPVTITAINRDYEKAVDVNQLWAQVVHLYRTGTTPELSAPERQALASVYAEHEVENPLQTYLQLYFKIEPGNTDLKCFTAEIIQRLQAFGVNLNNNPKVAGREINDALAQMGPIRKYISIAGIKGWGWIGIAPNEKREPI